VRLCQRSQAINFTEFGPKIGEVRLLTQASDQVPTFCDRDSIIFRLSRILLSVAYFLLSPAAPDGQRHGNRPL
jgi:hypothetical protein